MSWYRPCAAFLIAALAAVLFSACASKHDLRTARDSGRYIRDHHLAELPQFDIPVELNERVVAWMEYFQGPGRRHFERYLERSGRYIPIMTKILREQGLPRDLVYISLIESGFNTSAYSRAAAVGPWQFISGTGRRYGMRNDGWVDERRDPIRSTYAAAAYFRDLYNEFGDWYLAMAGYNAGEGRVRNAIESTGSRNFWVMADDGRVFRAETRDYVPKYIAAAIMAKAPERFGFTNINYQSPLDFETGRVESQTDIGAIARCAGVDEQAITDLNPHLVRGATPPSDGNFEVRLPRGTSMKFRDAYARLPVEERIQIVRYQARSGDTIAKISRRVGISASQLAEANGMSIKQKLHRGQTIVIPAGAAARLALAQDDTGDSDRGSSHVTKYRVRKGDSLGSIANKHHVSVAKLRAWNDLGRKSKIHRGQVLKVYRGGDRGAAAEVASAGSSRSDRAAAKTHVVRKGETVGGIAAKYGVSSQQLLAMNHLKNPKALRAGQKLTVRSGKAAPAAAPADDAPAENAQTAAALTPGEDAAEIASAAEGAAIREAAPVPTKSVETKMTVSSQKHRVKKGETLGAIASKYGVTTRELLSWNKLKSPKALRAGQTIVIKTQKRVPSAELKGSPVKLSTLPGPAKAEPVAAATPAAGTPVKLASAGAPAKAEESLTHRVKGGETLWEIARRHKVTIAQLQKWNNLGDPSAVKPGMTLKIMKN